MSLSPEQCRAARALLDWQQADLSRQSKVGKKTIIEFERGRTTPWVRTIDDLREAFERAGIEFLDAQEGVGGLGLRMRDGFKPVTREDAKNTRDKPSGDGQGALDALGWDWDTEPVDGEDDGPLPPLEWSDEDRAEQIEYWRARPERWNAMFEISRQCLLKAMGVDQL